MLTETRPDHGAEHDGLYAAYVRVSTDKQDVESQIHGIKAYLNGGDYKVKWFKEEGVSTGTDWMHREELHKCFEYCRKTGATMVIYTLSRLSRRLWETLRFMEQEVATGKIKLVCVDNPHLDHNTLPLLSAVAQMERNNIRKNTKKTLAAIKAEIAEKGSYTSKSGRTITKLGVHSKLSEAQKKGNDKQASLADERAESVGPMIQNLREQGLSYNSIAQQLNLMGVEPPSRRRNPNLSRKTQWHKSTVRNYIIRLEQ